MASSTRWKNSNFSFSTISARSDHEIPNPYLIPDLLVFWIDQYTAKNESAKKTMSKTPHHEGCASPCSPIPALAMKRNGVAKQCIKQSPLANIPIQSDLRDTCDIVIN